MDALIGRTIGGYHLVSALGRGGMSVVYLAERLDDPQALVAVKLLAPPPLADAPERAKAHTRCVREIETATHLDHPHILRALAYGEAPMTGEGATTDTADHRVASERDTASAIQCTATARSRWRRKRAPRCISPTSRCTRH